MTPRAFQAKPLLRLAGFLTTSLLVLSGCKNSQWADTASLSQDSAIPTVPTTQDSDEQSPQEKLNIPSFRTGLTPIDWFTKKNITAAEAQTVNALLESVEAFGGPSGNPVAAARWAEGRMQVAFLADYGLTEVSPILPFKRIVTLYITGNKLTQEQFNALLENLPNLKTVVKDPYIKCDNIVYPRVTCLE